MDLKRRLQTVGKSCFVKYFEYFKKGYTGIEMQNIIEENYTQKAKASRTSHANAIFREGLEKEALDNIIHSDNVDYDTRRKARMLLDNL